MKVQTIFCDICESEIKCLNQEVNLLPNNIRIIFGSGSEIEYEHVCQQCLKKVLNTIEDIIKLKGE